MTAHDDLRQLAFHHVLALPTDDDAKAPTDPLHHLAPADREMVSRLASRRLAFQLLFELDVAGDRGDQWLADTLARVPALGPMNAQKVQSLARGAFDNRAAADAEFHALAPDWPPHRLAAVDRAILRLAHFEMTTGATSPKIALSEAVELAKHFSTEKSPAFINGLLDRVLHRLVPAPKDA